MTFFIDRRENPKNKSAVNRQRFLRRYRKQIRESVRKKLDDRSITDTEQGEKVSIPARDTAEPFFHHGPGGRHTHVLPGNKEFVPGDKLGRPKGGGGGAGEGEASDQGEGMDEFVFELSREEFLDFLFEDMELPNLTKQELVGSSEVKKVRAGFSTDGAPGNISRDGPGINQYAVNGSWHRDKDAVNIAGTSAAETSVCYTEEVFKDQRALGRR